MATNKKAEQDTQKDMKKTDKRGFYAALTICFLAIGIAAWSTYDTMTDLVTPAKTGASSETAPEETAMPSAAARAEKTVVEQKADDAEISTVTVDAEPETEEVYEVDVAVEPAEEEASAQETAAAPVMYTPSDSWLRPVGDGELLAVYSEAPVYSETMRDYRVHSGADYSAERGETVKAVANGIVKDAYTDMLLGNILVIEHGDKQVRYCGLGETRLVDIGEVVRAGQDIGSVTAAPFESAMAPHLHLEVIKNGEPVDPESMF